MINLNVPLGVMECIKIGAAIEIGARAWGQLSSHSALRGPISHWYYSPLDMVKIILIHNSFTSQ